MDFLKKLYVKTQEDNITGIGAQLSYYLILSIFPFAIFFLNILSYTPIAREDMVFRILEVLPLDTQRILSDLIFETINTSSETLLSLSAITGIWAASKGVMALIKALNKAYGVKENRNYIQLRLIAVLFTLALMLLLLIVLLTLVFGELIGANVFGYFGMGSNFMVIWKYLRIILSLLSMVFIFSLFFRYIPAIENGERIKYKYVLPGAIFSTLGWIITSTLFSFYVNNFSNYGKTYGSIGGIIILLVWLYISSIIIVMGGEINSIIAKK